MHNPSNKVFIAKSLDGYIAGKNGEIDWLDMIPNPDHSDLGWNNFIKDIDAILMGRKTFDFVASYDGDWPYTKPLYVLSSTLEAIPARLESKASLVNGTISDVLKMIHMNGHTRLYIDGGSTIQSFLKEDLIDELIITTLPILLGGGIPLFGDLEKRMVFEHVGSQLFLDQLVTNHYRRKR